MRLPRLQEGWESRPREAEAALARLSPHNDQGDDEEVPDDSQDAEGLLIGAFDQVGETNEWTNTQKEPGEEDSKEPVVSAVFPCARHPGEKGPAERGDDRDNEDGK